MRSDIDMPKPAASKRKAEEWIAPCAKALSSEKLCLDDRDVAEMLMALASGVYAAPSFGVSVR